jgi:hypothetical protein
MAETAARPPARGCDGCDLCCRTYEIAELKKPVGTACVHLSALGCGIHGSHPKTCRTFRCLWLDEPALGEVWRPSRSGFVLRPDPDGVTLWVDVDPLRPGAWRALPYHPQIVTWSWAIRNGRGVVMVHDAGGVFVVFPEAELFLPDPPRGARFRAGYRAGTDGPEPWAEVFEDVRRRAAA